MMSFDKFREAIRLEFSPEDANDDTLKYLHRSNYTVHDALNRIRRELDNATPWTDAEIARNHIENKAPVTLDGREATISGFKGKFATVWELHDQARRVQYTWDTVVRVLKAGGNFKS